MKLEEVKQESNVTLLKKIDPYVQAKLRDGDIAIFGPSAYFLHFEDLPEGMAIDTIVNTQRRGDIDAFIKNRENNGWVNLTQNNHFTLMASPDGLKYRFWSRQTLGKVEYNSFSLLSNIATSIGCFCADYYGFHYALGAEDLTEARVIEGMDGVRETVLNPTMQVFMFVSALSQGFQPDARSLHAFCYQYTNCYGESPSFREAFTFP